MCNKKKYIWRVVIIIAVALLLPVILNFVVGLERPNNISVVGYPETWIGFYGSYIGGVLTALIGFLTLWQTSKNNDKKLRIAYQKSIVEDLERTLTQCVSLFDFSRLGTISLYFNNPDKYDEVLQKLDEYYRHVLTVANAWAVIYDGNEKTEVKNFQNIYHRCVKELIEYINDVSKAIVRLKDSSKEEQASAVSDIKVVLGKEAEYNCLLHELFEQAKFWLASERTELQRLQR